MARTAAAFCLLALLGTGRSHDPTIEEMSLLQLSLQPGLEPQQEEKMDALAPLAHHWPHIRGRTGKYSVIQYPMVISSGNLSDSLLWSKDFGPSDWMFSVVIDHERNIYVAGLQGTQKLSPKGEVIWTYPEQAFSAVLVGNALCGQTNFRGRKVYCLSLKTGKPFWSRMVSERAGFGGNYIEANNGVIMVTGGEHIIEGIDNSLGVPNDRVFGLNASTGEELWQFKVSCGLWVHQALFPDEDTTLFQDPSGGIYRLGLFNGSVIWHTPGSPGSFTDGAAILGPDGSVYGCSGHPDTQLLDSMNPTAPGVLRKFRLSDGAVLWTAKTPYPCTNIPSVSADGSTVVVAPGAIPPVGGAFQYKQAEIRSLPHEGRLAFKDNFDRMMRNNTLRSLFNISDLTGAIMGFDARTGELLWRHEVPPSGGIQAAGDQERNWRVFIEQGRTNLDITPEAMGQDYDKPGFQLPHCGPVHWSPASTDLNGRVYIGDSAHGVFRVYDPKTDKELDFRVDDGFLPGGTASAPGLLVFATCQAVYAFKAEEA